MKPDSAPCINPPVSPPPAQENVTTSPLTTQRELIPDYIQEVPNDDLPKRINVISTPSSPTLELVSTLPPALPPTYDLPSDSRGEILTNDEQCISIVNMSPSLTREHIPTSPSASPDKLLNNYVQETSTGDKQHVNDISNPSTFTWEHLPTSLPALTSPDNLASDPMHHQQYITAVRMSPSSSPARENSPTSPLSRPDKPLSNHTRELSVDEQQFVNGVTSTTSSYTQEHVATSQSSPLGIPKPPNKFHPTLSCWIKNMDKLESLINRLEEIAFSVPAQHQSQILKQVAALRGKFKRQQERITKFLKLSEEYANKYLLDISAEIREQSSFLEKLEGRLEAAKKLHEDANELKQLYETGTVAIMQGLRAKGKVTSSRLQGRNIKSLVFSNSAAVSRGPRPVQRGGLVTN
jgi:hypothetical protein